VRIHRLGPTIAVIYTYTPPDWRMLCKHNVHREGNVK
jgi:hypothetical protein